MYLGYFGLNFLNPQVSRGTLPIASPFPSYFRVPHARLTHTMRCLCTMSSCSTTAYMLHSMGDNVWCEDLRLARWQSDLICVLEAMQMFLASHAPEESGHPSKLNECLAMLNLWMKPEQEKLTQPSPPLREQ